MSFGSPIIINSDAEKKSYVSLDTVSVRRDDPNSFQETLLQELIDATPNVLPVREYLPSTTMLFSLGREIPVDLGANQGFIDNLLVTNDGYLVIIETKLYRNPEGIRDVIAQTLQYGMAVGQISLMELESRIKRGQSPSLKSGENISDCVIRQANEQNRTSALSEDFEEALERHLRRGEVLLLIVSDGIHVGVERVTHWLNEQGNSSPFKLGLIELKFHRIGKELLVVPRTVLKTREVSRHVVVVDIRPGTDTVTSAAVIDEFRSKAGGQRQESRPVKVAGTPLTKQQLLQLTAPEDRESFTALFEALEVYPLDFRGLATALQIGFYFPEESEEFHPLGHLYKGGVWAYPLGGLRRLFGSEAMIEFHRKANVFGPFYKSDDRIANPESFGGQVRYSQLANKTNEFAAFLNEYRCKAIELLEAGEAG